MAITAGCGDPAGCDLVVNATPLGMQDRDPLPFEMERIAPGAAVADVVLKPETPFLQAARARGCPVQIGTDMLFEQLPAYAEFFGFGAVTVEELRAVADIVY